MTNHEELSNPYFLLLILTSQFAQNCLPEGISTNPDTPVDPFFLTNIIDPQDPSVPFTINPFLNQFDWGDIAGADFKTIGIDPLRWVCNPAEIKPIDRLTL
ncbi:MAG: hypothetical protein WBG42_15205 [Cryomorphaceae bacterium]